MAARMEGTGSQRFHRSGKSCGRLEFILPLVILTGLSAGHKLTLAQAPSVDSLNPNVSYYVGQVAVQADGKILIGGGFTTVDTQSHVRDIRGI